MSLRELVFWSTVAVASVGACGGGGSGSSSDGTVLQVAGNWSCTVSGGMQEFGFDLSGDCSGSTASPTVLERIGSLARSR